MLTSNIQKGGALLDDCRRVVEAWDTTATADENFERIASENLLAKPSRMRSDDVLLRIIKPRLVEPDSHVVIALKNLLREPRAFTEACYYETARDDSLLAAFAEGPLWAWWQGGRIAVSIADVMEWLSALASDGRLPEWTDSVRTKVARGLLAALRDFGILRGGARKEIARTTLSPRGFAYAACREHEQGASSRALVTSVVWRHWLLEEEQVLDLFAQAAKLGVLRFSHAGSTVRIDWSTTSLEEVTSR